MKAIHPTEWVYSNEVERRSQARKREMIQKVFGFGFIPEIEWVDGSHTNQLTDD
jgi:hypothetical protein